MLLRRLGATPAAIPLSKLAAPWTPGDMADSSSSLWRCPPPTATWGGDCLLVGVPVPVAVVGAITWGGDAGRATGGKGGGEEGARGRGAAGLLVVLPPPLAAVGGKA